MSAPFKVGDRIVAKETHSSNRIVKGVTYTVTGIPQHIEGGAVQIDGRSDTSWIYAHRFKLASNPLADQVAQLESDLRAANARANAAEAELRRRKPPFTEYAASKIASDIFGVLSGRTPIHGGRNEVIIPVHEDLGAFLSERDSRHMGMAYRTVRLQW